MNKAAILVVDDEPINFDVIEALLDDGDYVLHYASNGQEALDCLGIFAPDLILLDVMMPGLDGIEVCRRIKAMPQWQAVPVVMVTALTEKQDLARCLNEGADDFLSKPLSPPELRARVQSMLRHKRQFDTIQSLSGRQASTIAMLQSSLQELRSNVATSLPHELNTPLHGISGIIELLLRHRDGMDDTEIDEFLGLAQQSTKRLERLIHRFLLGLQLGLVGDGEQKTSKPTARPNAILSTDFIASCAKEQSQAAQREGDLGLSLPLASILADPGDLTFIIEELLGNAFKFSDPGKPVTVSGETVGNDLELKITDRGRGMTKDQMDRIGAFMQFDRGHYEQQGIGLGLEIVKKLTACHQWRFSMTSTVGLGTEVGIGLPLASPATGLPRGG